MGTKQKFLNELRTRLRKYPHSEAEDYVDYYDELISERVANGEEEAAVLQQIGTAKAAATSFKQYNTIDQAVKKPTISNGLKAFIAVLSVLSLPLLIPVLASLILLLLVIILLFAAGFAMLVLGVLTAILSVAEMLSIVLAGDAPVYLLLLVVGIAIIVLVLAFQLMRALLFLGRQTTRAAIQQLKSRYSKSKRQNHRLNTEER